MTDKPQQSAFHAIPLCKDRVGSKQNIHASATEWQLSVLEIVKYFPLGHLPQFMANGHVRGVGEVLRGLAISDALRS